MYLTTQEFKKFSQAPFGIQAEYFVYQVLLAKTLGYWAFHGPIHKGKELADVFFWWNEVVLLFEVKSREKRDKPRNSWIRDRIRDAVASINDRARLLMSGDQVVLSNRWRGEAKFDAKAVKYYYGILVMNHGSEPYDPHAIAGDVIGGSQVPITVIKLEDLIEVITYLNTAWDIVHYFEARLGLGVELAVGKESEVFESFVSGSKLPTQSGITPEGLSEIQQHYISRMHCFLHSRWARSTDYEKFAAGGILDFCLGRIMVQADKDTDGKAVGSARHSAIVRGVGSLAELSNLRRTKHGLAWHRAANEAVISPGDLKKSVFYTRLSSRAYIYIAVGVEATFPDEASLGIISKGYLASRPDINSCLVIAARAGALIQLYEMLLANIKDQVAFDDQFSLGQNVLFMEKVGNKEWLPLESRDTSSGSG